MMQREADAKIRADFVTLLDRIRRAVAAGRIPAWLIVSLCSSAGFHAIVRVLGDKGAEVSERNEASNRL